jgi:hypothetical protein
LQIHSIPRLYISVIFARDLSSVYAWGGIFG